ncbi:MAG: YciI family protein [Pirellula sp.]
MARISKSVESLSMDGPFAETREVLGGYYLILARNQDEALSIAARHSGARVGSVEVRPLLDVFSLRYGPEFCEPDVEMPVGQSTT